MTQAIEHITLLAKAYKVKLVWINKSVFINHGAYFAGRKPEIHMGLCDNADIVYAVFFHELGHHHLRWIPGTLRIQHEYDAWQYAWKLMEKHKVKVTNKMRKMATECIHDYEGWERIERKGWLV